MSRTEFPAKIRVAAYQRSGGHCEECSAHGLRKSRLTALAEGGATTHQIAAWGGHESLKEVEHYTKSAGRRAAVMGTERGGNGGKIPDQTCKEVKK